MTTLMLIALLQGRNTLEAAPTTAPPQLDGRGDDASWGNAVGLDVRVGRAAFPGRDRYEVSMRALYDNENIYFLVSWPDRTESDQHKRYEWGSEAGAWLETAELEDAFSIAFPIEGNFTADMYSADEAVWDVWEWGAARTNPVAYATDRTHTMTLREPRREPRGVRVTARNNADLWIIREHDGGTPCFEHVEPPNTGTSGLIPQYNPRVPAGSAADVRASGRWADDRWTLEMSRALNTRQRDDARLETRRGIAFGIATFDAEEDLEHRVSTVFQLRFRE